MEILKYVVLFWIAFLLGFLFKALLTSRLRDTAVGTIVIDRDILTERTVYSLVLDDYPEKLEFKKMVVFNVDASHLDLERE